MDRPIPVFSAEYDAGAKAIRLERSGNSVKATEAWTSNRLRVHHGNAMHIDGSLYFSSGGKGSVALLTAIGAATGKIYWQERAVSKATFIWADGKLITLDQNGTLFLANPSPNGWKVLAKAELVAGTAVARGNAAVPPQSPVDDGSGSRLSAVRVDGSRGLDALSRARSENQMSEPMFPGT